MTVLECDNIGNNAAELKTELEFELLHIELDF